LLLSEFMSVSYKQEDIAETVTYASIYSFSKSLNTIFVFLPLNTKKLTQDKKVIFKLYSLA
jgi:hypothetical protein